MIKFYYGCEDLKLDNEEWLITIKKDFKFDPVSHEVKNLISFTDWEPKTFEEFESNEFISWQNEKELIFSSIKKSLDLFFGRPFEPNFQTTIFHILTKEIQSSLKLLETKGCWIIYFKH